MTKPVTKAETLVTPDGVPIEAVHLHGDRALGIVVAHGFTLHWQGPHVWRVARRLNEHAGVVAFDFRGHGRSGGATTLGDKEIQDVDTVVRYARELGYERVVTVGFSMGASTVLRHAGILGGVDGVVSVSGPGRWYYRGTPSMRRVHWAVEHRTGRFVAKRVMKTRISQGRWDPVPMPPAEAAAMIAPTPVLIVHGDRDEYFPSDHAEQLFEAARQPKELWIVPGLGHAESAVSGQLLDRIARWAFGATSVAASPNAVA
ncbi:MAG TPA: alpha/beta fold hydrolase [Streptosporangiaceae bacterium]|nr:alpha/beta fold hydrolase [Streptosporangiaceae bacterium]